MRVHLIYIFLFCALISKSQESRFGKASEFLERAEYERALELYQSTAQELFEEQDYINYAKANLFIVDCKLGKGEIRSSLLTSNEIISFIDENIVSDSLMGRAMTKKAECLMRLGQTDVALELLNSATEQLPEGSLELAECFESIGLVYWSNGNIEVAHEYLDKSLSIRRRVPESVETEGLIADSYINLGLLYIDKDPIEAVMYFEKALALYEDLMHSAHVKFAYVYSNLAFANANMSNYQMAIDYLDKVDQVWNSIHKGEHPNKAYAKSNRGRIMEMMGEYQEAMNLQQEALASYQILYGKKHPEIANAYYLIGEIYFKQEEYFSSIESYQKAIYANLIDQEFESVYDLPELSHYFSADILLYSLQSKAVALEAYHFQKKLKLKDIQSALSTYQLCDELVTDMRRIRVSEKDKLRLSEIAYEIYNRAIETSVYLSSHTFKKDYYQQLAFGFSERSKSGVLQEAIIESNAKEYGGIPKTEIAFEDSIKKQISYLELELAGESNRQRLGMLKDELFTYKSELRGFTQKLEVQYPQYYELKYDHEILSVSALQENLSESTALLSYFLGEKTVYKFLITKDKLDVKTINIEGDIVKKIQGLRNSIKYQDAVGFDLISTELYDQLIPKIGSNIRELVIIPDGVLGTIPFETLSYPANGRVRYLIQDYKLSYDYSAKLLYNRMFESTDKSTHGILLMAPVDFSENDTRLSDLPESKQEIDHIKHLFLGDNWRTTISVGEDARESVLKSDSISSYKYIHLATHGLVNESKPELSKVFLKPGDGEDGSLHSSEIYNIHLRADMVSLSACETGLGKISKGEGVVGLSRSLMYAGADNILVSLWQVSDESTAEFMIEFYKHHIYHSDDNLFADDLRWAKIRLIKSDEYSFPYYWAPFILVGL